MSQTFFLPAYIDVGTHDEGRTSAFQAGMVDWKVYRRSQRF